MLFSLLAILCTAQAAPSSDDAKKTEKTGKQVKQQGDFMDVWVTSAFEDTNVFAGPEAYSPSANFVQRGNRAFFEDYESRSSDDISRAQLVLYRKDDGNWKGWSTEAAFVLRYTPYLNPDQTDPGTNLEDDGSYVRIIKNLDGKDHTLSLTGYAVDSGRFRLGYSYDLTWGGREIYAFTTGAAPGVRAQWQKGGHYAFAGVKSAVGDYVDPDTRLKRNQAYYGFLAGGGVQIQKNLKLEMGAGSFQQGQIQNVDYTTSTLYGEPIMALGYSGQIAWRSNPKIRWIESADLKLYRNTPDFVKDSYISHRQLKGTGVLIQAEIDRLSHNLLDPEKGDTTTIETGTAGDLQTLLVSGSTSVGVDVVYKDLAYILFNVPGLTSGVAMSPDMEQTAQLYGRMKVSHYFAKAHIAPTVGFGWMRPATYETSGGTFVQYTERDKEQVPEGQDPSPIMSGIAGVQVDMSKSVVIVAEALYTVDKNQSEFVKTDENPSGTRQPAPENEQNVLGMNIMMRARF
jgi:hypothetical protein